MRQRLAAMQLMVVGISLGCAEPDDSGLRWRKGNLHTHTLWSDGDDYPESVLDWYRGHEYDFVAISDHNTLAQGERWIDVATSAGGTQAFEHYVARFGTDWVEQRPGDGGTLARLKTYAEYRDLFEQPGVFLVIQSEEITDRFEAKPLHVNATNVRDLVVPQGGSSVLEVLQNNIDEVLEQRRATGLPMFPHVNHPNFGWAVSVDDMAALEGENFFEVYNGHPLVNNEGNDLYPSTEEIWDLVLTARLLRGDGPIFGIAVDDAHDFHRQGGDRSNPGRGWIMVRAPELTAGALIDAMERGDFYGSSGVTLRSVELSGATLRVEIEPVEGATYTTRFVGTSRVDAMVAAAGEGESVRARFGEVAGSVLQETPGNIAVYRFTGDELYVRAVVRSSRLKENPYREGEMEMAWTQPVIVP